MPDRTKLKVGDEIILNAVPAADLMQREHEMADRTEDAGWTADTIERILAQDPVVTIDRIDEFGIPWFDYVLTDKDDPEEHSLAIMDDESWAHRLPTRSNNRA